MYSLWFLRDSPDVLIVVGSGRAVHRFAGHRTLLASHSGYLKSQLTADTHQVAVPSVSPDAFAPLLTFMYTGYLDLTPDNIYGVLLATHLLHMPRALDLCRAYLVQSQPPPVPPPPPPPPPTVPQPPLVKPVPSRKPFPSLLAAGPPFWSPPALLPPAPEPFAAPAFPAAASAPDPTPDVRRSPPAVASTSAERDPSPPPSSLSPCLSQGSDASDRVTVTVPPAKLARRDGKVIVDVASCDGPVRFHRVLNENYGKGKSPAAAADGEKSAEVEGEVYRCRYCEHTFKSQYCYQKHARRHLNPVRSAPKAAGAAADRPRPKREVRLLDMNVQYYPCKTCGSKFPSYYFVHKHRKLCHPHEEAGGGGGGGGGTGGGTPGTSAGRAATATPTGSEASEITV